MQSRIGLPLAAVALVGLAVGALVVLRGGDDGSVSGAGSVAVGVARPATPSITSLVAAPGELVQLSGRCPATDGVVAGPVVIEEVRIEGAVTVTDVTAASWTVAWEAPVDAATSALRIWCGEGGGAEFPADREIAVRYRIPPAPTTDGDRPPLPPLPDT